MMYTLILQQSLLKLFTVPPPRLTFVFKRLCPHSGLLQVSRNTMFGSQSFLISRPRSEELRKEARQLKKELQAIKQRKEESLKPAEDKAEEGM